MSTPPNRKRELGPRREARGKAPDGPGARQLAAVEPGPLQPGPFGSPLTVAQVARILGTSQDTVRRLLRERRIAHERVSSRRTVIRASALRAYIDSVTVEARS
jgi:excisionase family DNA binding protein